MIVGPTDPRLPPSRRALPGMGPVRVVEVPAKPGRGAVPHAVGPAKRRRAASSRMFVILADAPVNLYDEAGIERGLGDLEWVSRAAVAHERVIEAFLDVTALLPMKLFTIFKTEERALEYIAGEKRRFTAAAKRVADHHEWGMRVAFDPLRARVLSSSRVPARKRSVVGGGGEEAVSGATYLRYKKAQLRAAAEGSALAKKTASALYDRVAAHARSSVRRAATDDPGEGRTVLLDAAFLVPRSRTAKFRAVVAREARSLAPQGYGLTLTGPWPPYSFVQD
ncbi:MAG TPA: GvpL/GvpF family gas vesicle protein [Polyangiaceae bacterium]|nr:GvpL/GvpF family gas vesicle protein [Polyangiaceae bacterium]